GQVQDLDNSTGRARWHARGIASGSMDGGRRGRWVAWTWCPPGPDRPQRIEFLEIQFHPCPVFNPGMARASPGAADGGPAVAQPPKNQDAKPSGGLVRLWREGQTLWVEPAPRVLLQALRTRRLVAGPDDRHGYRVWRKWEPMHEVWEGTRC